MKRIAILTSEYNPTVDAIKSHLDGFCDVEVLLEELKDYANYDLVVGLGIVPKNVNALCSHYSLLPAFEGDNPVAQAFLAGVKVTGVTIYLSEQNKIVAQYPIFISNASHFDEVERELAYVEQALLPVVIEKILKNEAFETRNLLSKGCSGSCGGCKGCSH